ncbi:hypothetical protein BGZ46_004101, partial [Entomortierella lignicola]
PRGWRSSFCVENEEEEEEDVDGVCLLSGSRTTIPWKRPMKGFNVPVSLPLTSTSTAPTALSRPSKRRMRSSKVPASVPMTSTSRASTSSTLSTSSTESTKSKSTTTTTTTTTSTSTSARQSNKKQKAAYVLEEPWHSLTVSLGKIGNGENDVVLPKPLATMKPIHAQLFEHAVNSLKEFQARKPREKDRSFKRRSNRNVMYPKYNVRQ